MSSSTANSLLFTPLNGDRRRPLLSTCTQRYLAFCCRMDDRAIVIDPSPTQDPQSPTETIDDIALIS